MFEDDPALLFRKEFQIGSKLRRARVYVSGLGYYEPRLNGEKVGDQVLDPGWTTYSKRVLYSTYDVTAQLKRGCNALGVILGNGWFNPLPLRLWGHINPREHLTIGEPRVIMQLVAEFEDGTVQLGTLGFTTRFLGPEEFTPELEALAEGESMPFESGMVERTSGDQLRVSYAYADLADSVTGIRGRIGRQSRATGGVLGRFDGLNLAYHVTERTLVEAVFGKPAYSSMEGLDPAVTFYGVSADFQPFFENLEVGTFFLQQDIEGIRDRQVVGTEVRYFGPNQTLWGMIDYDLGFGEIASGFLQGSWRFPSRFSIHGLIDRRGSPFMSVGNAIIGQPVLTFAELTSIFTEDELRQLGRDRTSMSTTFTLGVSYPLSPKLQINVDASQSEMEGTPASGGVLATEATSYNYYSANLVASSLFTEGDVTIIGARYSDSDTSQAISLSLDSRFPIGRSWRINPRLRVDRRNRLNFDNYEWLYTPGIRIQYRRSQKFRIELEAGRQYVQQDAALLDNDRESNFFNIGYQAFF